MSSVLVNGHFPQVGTLVSFGGSDVVDRICGPFCLLVGQ